MSSVALLFMVFAAVTTAQPAPTADAASTETPKQQARDQAAIGHNYLHLNRLADAQTACDAALKLDPANHLAKDCLDKVASMLIDQDLNNADAALRSGNKSGAVALASKWTSAATDWDQRERAWKILKKARASSISDLWNMFTPDWLRQVLVAIIILSGCWVLLLGTRKVWRASQRNEWRRKKWRHATAWTMLPFKEVPGTPDAQTGVPTNLVLDAFTRLGHELKRENSWGPKLLLLRPTPPADYEPALITEFLPEPNAPGIRLTPNTGKLSVLWEMHSVQLDSAVQNLQLKTATGIDLGSVARFIGSIVSWFTAGAPTISGVAEKTDKAVSIHLAATGGPVKSVAVTTSTDVAPGVDAMQLSAERSAFKFLYRLRNVDTSVDEVDALSALRQGAMQFAQYAETVPGVGDNAGTRTSSLQIAAFNFNFFRASVPLPRDGAESHASDPQSGKQKFDRGARHRKTNKPTCVETGLPIDDNMRQAILLAEGVAHALIGSEHDRLARLAENAQVPDAIPSVAAAQADGAHGGKDQPRKESDAAGETAKSAHTSKGSKDGVQVDHATLAKQEHTAAIDCFRQLQDWPGTPLEDSQRPAELEDSPAPARGASLRDQARYNEAVVWRQMGHIGRSVLLLTDLLGEKTKDTAPAEAGEHTAGVSTTENRNNAHWQALPDSIRLPALLARLSAFAEYSREDWTVLPRERAKLLLADGETLVGELFARSNKGQPRTHDERLAQYMYIEALRALGHVQVLYIVTGAADLSKECLERAIEWMRKCEDVAPSRGLYCDLAEAHLLLGDLDRAEGYARHATLRSNNQDERANYLAAESCFLASEKAKQQAKTDPKKEKEAEELRGKAKKYAEDFKGTPRLDEFKSLRKDLELEDAPKSAKATA